MSTLARSRHSSVPGAKRQSATACTRWSRSGEWRRSSAAASASPEPITTARHEPATAGTARALAVISGPTPAGSPMVMPIRGARVLMTPILREG